MIPEFPHHPPKGYTYEFEDHKRGVVSIWLHCNRKFDYNLGKPTRTIWGFYKTKTKQYYAPVNSKTVGDLVDISETRNYTAMPIKLTPLESAFK